MSSIEERIRKLLALADSPNENEAAAAAEKAQALMLRYGIELATIAAAAGERLAVDEHVIEGKLIRGGGCWPRRSRVAPAVKSYGRRAATAAARARSSSTGPRARSAGWSSCTAISKQ